MCPDRQMISVYLDGELPSPWKEKMENHLAQCPQCREQLDRYRMISAPGAPAEASLQEAPLLEAQERVWRNLEARERFRRNESGLVPKRRALAWGRSVSVPFPVAAAAAAALVIAVAAIWTRRPTEQPLIPQMTIAPQEAIGATEVVPIADMNGVLQYLGSTDNGGDILILRLPESRNFTSSGEPAILKAADYTRRQP